MVWYDVKEKLPTKNGWYLVYVPSIGYSTKDCKDHMMFSKYSTASGKWSVEHAGALDRTGCVEYWQYLNPPRKRRKSKEQE